MSSSESGSTKSGQEGSDGRTIGLSDSLAIAILVFSTVSFVIVLVQLAQSVFANARGLPNCNEKVLGLWAARSGLRLRHVWHYLKAEVEFEAPIIFVAVEGNPRGPLRPKQTNIMYARGDETSQKDYRVDLKKEIVVDYTTPTKPPAREPTPAPGAGDRPDPRSWPTRFRLGKSPRLAAGNGETGQGTGNGAAAHAGGELDPPATSSDEDAARRQVAPPIIRKPRERIATIAHERVTWLTLLIAVQRMERDSLEWDNAQWDHVGMLQPQITMKQKLSVGIQVLKRSFETNPSVKKPYATSTICHIVELAAMLGIYWKEFDRKNDRYRAEGNGYSVNGYRIADFGIVFAFEQNGWPAFEETRLIHAIEIKEYCFGNVPTIYRNHHDDVDWEIPYRGQQKFGRGIQTLQLGSRKEIAETLSAIGCNTNTVFYYLGEDYRHIHLFPVVFEILGMLARTLRVRGRCYTYLPNPTVFSWNRSTFSVRRMLQAFASRIQGLKEYRADSSLGLIKVEAARLDRELPPPPEEDNYTPAHLDLIHDALDATDRILNSRSLDPLVVHDVLRRHVQEVLQAVNTPSGEGTAVLPPIDFLKKADTFAQDSVQNVEGLSRRPTRILTSASVGSVIQREISFDDLFLMPPEKQEEKFMEKYFELIRPRAITLNKKHHNPPAVERTRELRTEESMKEPTGKEKHTDDAKNHLLAALVGDEEGESSTMPPKTHDEPGTAPPKKRDENKAVDSEGNLIWCTLVFRMTCWLLLHNFDKMDKQVSKSELIGSRLPVYII